MHCNVVKICYKTLYSICILNVQINTTITKMVMYKPTLHECPHPRVGTDALADIWTSVTLAASWEKSLLSCCAASSCWSITLLDCDRALQAWKPSDHLWSSFVAPAAPQFPNQEPPRPQQLALPDFAMMPHLGHTKLMILVAAGVVYIDWWKVQTKIIVILVKANNMSTCC